MHDEKKTTLIGSFLLFAVIIVAIFAFINLLEIANSTAYPIKQAEEWNWRARATNNLIDMATNLNRSIELLKPFHGNPAWLFPKADTDIDQIRLNIEETRNTALAVAANATIGSQGYQQAVQNLQETIIEVNSHIDGLRFWLYFTPTAAVMTTIYFLLFVAMCIEGFVVNYDIPVSIIIGFVAWIITMCSVIVAFLVVP